ncbi:hypothetical protein ACKVWM_003442 [Pyricularia oryzae]
MTADSPVDLIMGNLALVGAGVGLIFPQGAAVLKTLGRGDATKKSDHAVVFLIMQLGGVALFMSVVYEGQYDLSVTKDRISSVGAVNNNCLFSSEPSAILRGEEFQ